METTLRVTYTRCGYCTAKDRCATCSRDLRETLLTKDGILAAEVNTGKHTLTVEHTMSKDDLLDLLEVVGLMAEE